MADAAYKCVASDWTSCRQSVRGVLDLIIGEEAQASLDVTYTVGETAVPNPDEFAIKMASPNQAVRQAAQGWIHGPAGSGGIYVWRSDDDLAEFVGGKGAFRLARATAECLRPPGHVIRVEYDDSAVIQTRGGWHKFGVDTVQVTSCLVAAEIDWTDHDVTDPP